MHLFNWSIPQQILLSDSLHCMQWEMNLPVGVISIFARSWKNLYNPDTGWLQSRNPDGSWKSLGEDFRESTYKNYFFDGAL